MATPVPDQSLIKAQMGEFDAVLATWATAMPGVDLASVSLSVRIGRLAALFNRGVEDLVRPFGFGYGELEVIFFLQSVGKPYQLRPKDLIRGCFVTSGAMTGRIDRLEKLGFVRRIGSSGDRRETLVELTPAGLAMARKLQKTFARDSGMILALETFSASERDLLEALVRRLLIAVEGVAHQVPSAQKKSGAKT